MTMYDAAPLLALVEPSTETGTDVEIAELLGVADRTVARWRSGVRITEANADRAALNLGLHPCLIWSNYWATAPGE